MKNIMITTCVGYETVCQDLVWQLTQEEQIDFVKQFDGMVADWDFTRRLRDYFVEEMKKEENDAATIDQIS